MWRVTGWIPALYLKILAFPDRVNVYWTLNKSLIHNYLGQSIDASLYRISSSCSVKYVKLNRTLNV